MKKLLFIFLCLTTLAIQTQTRSSNSNPYTSGVDEKLQLLDKSDLTTDILYDRVYPFAQLRHFNQVSADTSQAKHFYHAYAEMQTADYTDRWNSVSQLMQQVDSQPQNSIPIGILHVDFEYLDERAMVDNLLKMEAQGPVIQNVITLPGPGSLLEDVANRPRSPYLKKTALVISPLLTATQLARVSNSWPSLIFTHS